MHADYERPILSFLDPGGRELQVVEHHRDGIFFADPVKVMIYDPGRQVVAETPYCRDAIVRQTSCGILRVYGIHFVSDLLNSAWMFDGSRFIEPRPLLGCLFATAASVRQHWLGYTIAASCSLYGAVAYLNEAIGKGTGWFLPGFWSWFGFLVLVGVFLYSSLSVAVVAALTLMLTMCLADNLHDALPVLALYGGSTVLWLLYERFMDARVGRERRC